MDSLKSFLNFMQSGWGGLSAITVFFPFADQLTKIILIPVANEGEKFALMTINSLICCFVLLVCYSIQFQRKSVGLAIFMFIIGISTYFGYEYFISPINSFQLLGINADITYLAGNQLPFFKVLYLAIFGAFTGAFTSIAALFYRPQIGISRWY